MNLRAGTSGFSYKEWKGSFYPEDIRSEEMLGYYAERLRAVEINNTFYRMPTTKLLEGWAEKVPADFQFVLKASRRITHQKKLRDAGDDLEYLLETASVLGDRLGPLLIQLPPYLKKDTGLLSDFVSLFPDGARAAFEFRSSSWFDDDVYGLLEARSLALVVSDTGDEKLPPVAVRTAPYGYARLRRVSYEPSELEAWLDTFRGLGVRDMHVFFKHEDEATGPRLAAEFQEMAGAS